MKKKILLSSVVTIVLCLCLIAGSTYALFTKSDFVNVAVTAGKIDITASIDENSLQGWSVDEAATVENGVVYFANGGTATVNGAELTIALMTPGDKVQLDIDGEDDSNIAIKYRYVVSCIVNDGLMDALTVCVDGEECDPVDADGDGIYDYFASDWVAPATDGSIASVTVSVAMDVSIGNEYQDKGATLSVVLEAIQANGVDDQGNLIYP